MDAEMSLAVFYLAYYGTFYAITMGFAVVSYILTGKTLSAIARRRGIEKPWLAWVPVGSDWMLGCISDQYRYVSYGEQTNRRSKLLWYNIALLGCLFVVSAMLGVMIAMAALGASDDFVATLGILMLIPCFAMIPIAVVYSINYYKSCFDLFRSCDPDKSLVFLLVSIFASYPLPFFLYSCRNKDLGMPPRQDPEQLPEVE